MGLQVGSALRKLPKSEMKRRIAIARLFSMRVQFIDHAFQLFELLPSFAKVAFGCQALAVGKVFACLCNKCVEVGRLRHCLRCRRRLRCLRRA